MEQKRSLERFDLRCPATITVMAEDEEHQNELKNLLTENICSGGAYFHTDQPLPEGTPVKIDLLLRIEELKKLDSRQALIKVKGEVVRSESGGMAICFKDNYSIKPIS